VSLDLPTLGMSCALNIGFVGGVMLTLNRRSVLAGAGDTPLGLWGAALLMGAGGLLAGGLLTPPADRLIGNTLLLLAASLSWTAARTFSERPPMLVLMLGGPAAWLALTFASPQLDTIAIVCGLAAAYTAASAYELYRCRAERLPAMRLALPLLAIHVIVYVVRAMLDFVALPPVVDLAIPPTLLIEGTLHSIGMGFVLLSMTAERASHRATAGLRRQALVDGLTGVANRRHFDVHSVAETRRAARHTTPLAVLLIDADHFKMYNDRYGHIEGDHCLRAVAGCLTSFVRRPGDMVARFGGEEFAMLLPTTDLAGAEAVAEQLRTAVAALGIVHQDGPTGRVTVSIGVSATVPAPGADTPDLLLRAADRALYEAKAAGRNTVRVALPTTEEPTAHHRPQPITG